MITGLKNFRWSVFLLSFLLVALAPLGDDTSEYLRRKVENLSMSAKLNCGQTIQCVSTLSSFYQNGQFQPVWTSTRSSQLLKALARAEEEGLNAADYHMESLTSWKTKGQSPVEKAEYELLLTDAYLLYASHLLSGKVNPETVDAEWFVARREGDPMASLTQLLTDEGTSVEKWLDDLKPKHSTYKGLRTALQRLRNSEALAWEPLAFNRVLKPGDQGSEIRLLTERLKVLNDLSLNFSVPDTYSSELVEAVKRFQKRHGLEPDGGVGPKTISMLNIPISKRIEQIEVNMERWRWLPQEFGQYYLKVNIASFELEVFKNGQLLKTFKVIAGKPYRQTPVMSSKLHYLVFNPTWTVPPGILNNDILPAVRKDPGYLKKKKLLVLDAQGRELDPYSINWSSNAVKGYTYRQPAGPDNALGAVKFIFPNKFNVYLHDTPSRELFDKTERALSSGCIRVHQPLTLAELLLNDPSWNAERINALIKTNETKTVHLKEQPQVHLLYWTAWLQDNIIQFRADVYERDGKVAAALAQGAPSVRN